MTNLNELTIKAIVAMYNAIATDMGEKVVKTFKDKPTAIARTEKIQAAFDARVEEVGEEIISAASKRETIDPATPVTVINRKAKMISKIEALIVKAIEEDLCDTAGELAEYITANFKLPRTGTKADATYAARNIKLFADRKVIKLG